MKKISILFVMLAALLASCGNDEGEQNENVRPELFKTSINLDQTRDSIDNKTTRMTHDDNGVGSFSWESTDQIGLYSDALSNDNVNIDAQAAGNPVRFVAENVGVAATGTAKQFYAYYPYAAAVTGTTTALTGFELPTDQGDGSDWTKYALMYESSGMTADVQADAPIMLNGTMKNVFAFAKFKLRSDLPEYSGGTVKSIKIKSTFLSHVPNSNPPIDVKYLSGKYTADIQNGAATFSTAAGEASEEVGLSNLPTTPLTATAQSYTGDGKMLVIPSCDLYTIHVAVKKGRDNIYLFKNDITQAPLYRGKVKTLNINLNSFERVKGVWYSIDGGDWEYWGDNKTTTITALPATAATSKVEVKSDEGYNVSLAQLQAINTYIKGSANTIDVDCSQATFAENSMSQLFTGNTKLKSFEFPKVTSSELNLEYIFFNCSELISVSEIPDMATNMAHAFRKCLKFNQPVTIPKTATSLHQTFRDNINFNSLVTIPEDANVEDMYYAFINCKNFDQPITIPKKAKNLEGTFTRCEKLNSLVTISSDAAVTNMRSTFQQCYVYNQDITIPENVKSLMQTFADMNGMKGTISIYTAYSNLTNTGAFTAANCPNITLKLSSTIYDKVMDGTLWNGFAFKRVSSL